LNDFLNLRDGSEGWSLSLFPGVGPGDQSSGSVLTALEFQSTSILLIKLVWRHKAIRQLPRTKLPRATDHSLGGTEVLLRSAEMLLVTVSSQDLQHRPGSWLVPSASSGLMGVPNGYCLQSKAHGGQVSCAFGQSKGHWLRGVSSATAPETTSHPGPGKRLVHGHRPIVKAIGSLARGDGGLQPTHEAKHVLGGHCEDGGRGRGRGRLR